MEIKISTEKSRLDIHLIHSYLSQDSYWAQGRSIKTVKDSIANSMCFGAYIKYNQIGFARVVTDKAIFAWVMDLFILPEHQGKGHGKTLIQAIMDHPELQNLQRWGLATNDAHSLYEKYGFASLEKPELIMIKVNSTS